MNLEVSACTVLLYQTLVVDACGLVFSRGFMAEGIDRQHVNADLPQMVKALIKAHAEYVSGDSFLWGCVVNGVEMLMDPGDRKVLLCLQGVIEFFGNFRELAFVTDSPCIDRIKAAFVDDDLTLESYDFLHESHQ